MEDFVSNGRTIKFTAETGRVLPGQQKISKTHISSSGGGGYLHQGSGFVDAAKIKSTTTTQQEFWLLADGGRQVPVRLSGEAMAVNVDQQVSLMYAWHPKQDGHWMIAIVNHSAGTTTWLLTPLKLARSAGLIGSMGAALVALSVFVLFAVGGLLGAIPAAAILFIYIKKQRAIVASLAEHRGRQAQSLMARPSGQA